MLYSQFMTRGHFALFITIIINITSWPKSASVALRTKRLQSTTLVTSKVGETTILPCFSSTENPVLWQKRQSDAANGQIRIVAEDNVVINGFARRFKLNIADGHQNIVIRDTEQSDRGIYECIEKNGIGNTHTVELTVEDLFISQTPAFLHAKVTDSVSLPCHLQTTTNVLWRFYDDQWAKAAVNISVNGRILNKHKTRFSLSDEENLNDLVIHQVKISDSGVFQCIDNNGEGQSRYVFLYVTAEQKATQIEDPAKGVIQPVISSSSQDNAEFFNWKYHLLILALLATIGLVVFLLALLLCRKRRSEVRSEKNTIEFRRLLSSDTFTDRCQQCHLHGEDNAPVLAAIGSLEERISVFSGIERQLTRSGRSSSLQTVGAARVLTKPEHVDQLKFCEEIRNIASAPFSLFHYDEDLQQWKLGAGDVNPVEAAALAFQRIMAAVEVQQKLIRATDRSEPVEQVVQNHFAYSVVENAEDERRINEATGLAKVVVEALQDKTDEAEGLPKTSEATQEVHPKPLPVEVLRRILFKSVTVLCAREKSTTSHAATAICSVCKEWWYIVINKRKADTLIQRKMLDRVSYPYKHRPITSRNLVKPGGDVFYCLQMADCFYMIKKSQHLVSVHANDNQTTHLYDIPIENFSPSGFTASFDNQYVYVGDQFNRAVWKISPRSQTTTEELTKFIQYPSGGEFPSSLAAMEDGNLAVLVGIESSCGKAWSGRLDTHLENGTRKTSAIVPHVAQNPTCLGYTRNNTFAISFGLFDHGVILMDNAGTQIAICLQGFCSPRSVRYDETSNTIFVVDSGNRRIMLLDTELKIKQVFLEWKSSGFNDQSSSKNRPMCLSLDKTKHYMLVGMADGSVNSFRIRPKSRKTQ